MRILLFIAAAALLGSGCLKLEGSIDDETALIASVLPDTAANPGVTSAPVVAVADQGRGYYSPNGTTWTAVTITANTTVTLKAVTWTGTHFVAVGVSTSPAGCVVFRSADGQSWAQITVAGCAGASGDLNDVSASGDGRVVAVGTASTNTYAAYSSDHGASFTGNAGSPGGIALQRIGYDGSNFVTIQGGGSPRAHFGATGASFTNGGYPGGAPTGYSPTPGDVVRIPGTNQVVYAGQGDEINTTALTSVSGNSGATWTANSPSVFNAATTTQVRGIASNGTNLVAVGAGCRVDSTSGLSLAWSGAAQTVAGCTGANWQNLTYNGTYYIAVANTGLIGFSRTGSAGSWTLTTPATANILGVAAAR